MGGARLPDPCAPQDVTIPVPEAYKGRGRAQKATTCGCGDKAIFVMPYDRPEPFPDGAAMEAAFVRVCAYCDGMDLMPRVQEAVA